MSRMHVIFAVLKRNLASYFSGVLGYLFIVVFVFAAASLAFTPQFFANNLANLDQLNEVFPMLLLFIVPAITMSAWADEKKLGTEELLFTLPATDIEILLGKYLAVLCVYAIALGFSIFQVFVLATYAEPDWGLMLANYFGYFLAGAALLSAGMFASALTNNTTVAFVLGAAVCAVPVFMGDAADMIVSVSPGFLVSFFDTLAGVVPSREFIHSLSVGEQLREFGQGTIPLSGVVYFVSLTVFMLYLNLILISRRHWSSSQQTNMGLQFLIRTACLAAILVSLGFVVRKGGEVANLRADLTAEKVYTLSGTTTQAIQKLDEKRPVTIQAFVSPDVPREFVTHRMNLTGLLRQYDRLGGGNVEVRFVNVTPFSKESREAALLGIAPRTVQTERGGKIQTQDVYLGAVISSPYDEVAIPFFDVGIPVEYELTRSVQTVANQERKLIGILKTDAQLMQHFDLESRRDIPNWLIVDELRKQYNVEEVVITPGEPIDTKKYDVLLAVLPSSLTEEELNTLVDYIRSGRPTLVLDDPFPTMNVNLAPQLPKPMDAMERQRMQMMSQFGQPPQMKTKANEGRATALVDALSIAWDNGSVVWDENGMSLHPEYADVIRPELVFVSPKTGGSVAFNAKSDVTSGLQEMLLFYPGNIKKRESPNLEFIPLLRTSENSGEFEIFTRDFTNPFGGGITINDNPRRIPDEYAHVLAAHIKGKPKQGEEKGAKSGGLNVIYVADVDCISDQLFQIVQRRLHDLDLDNVKFILNAVDTLAGDTAAVALRNRRPKHRTLTEIQQQTSKFREESKKLEEQANKEFEEQLKKFKERLETRTQGIQKNESLSSGEKFQQILTAAEDETQQLKREEDAIQEKKRERLEEIKSQEQQKIRELEETIRLKAIFLPPLPAILLGIFILAMRLHSERSEIDPRRSVNG